MEGPAGLYVAAEASGIDYTESSRWIGVLVGCTNVRICERLNEQIPFPFMIFDVLTLLGKYCFVVLLGLTARFAGGTLLTLVIWYLGSLKEL